MHLGEVRWRLTASQVEGTEALQVPNLVAVDFAEVVVELVWEVAVGFAVSDMAARLEYVIWRNQWRVCFRSSTTQTRSICIRNYSGCGK